MMVWLFTFEALGRFLGGELEGGFSPWSVLFFSHGVVPSRRRTPCFHEFWVSKMSADAF